MKTYKMVKLSERTYERLLTYKLKLSADAGQVFTFSETIGQLLPLDGGDK